MKPTRQAEFTLSDVLHRVLDKGLIINADVVISVAGIPLVGISLRAAVAGMETMLAYGMMEGWDKEIRSVAPGQGNTL
ncbi:MAG: gas vesicle protein [Deltaproteobacteria bacterium]|nr:gas vesicle protein [Deltaproteobacteria bacterium]MBI5809764.1 gas vesicle protein [Deltaproteobacteria bacterium]